MVSTQYQPEMYFSAFFTLKTLKPHCQARQIVFVGGLGWSDITYAKNGRDHLKIALQSSFDYPGVVCTLGCSGVVSAADQYQLLNMTGSTGKWKQL